eukprot:1161554-Pelagomonas_calceolata.AAC.5
MSANPGAPLCGRGAHQFQNRVPNPDQLAEKAHSKLSSMVVTYAKNERHAQLRHAHSAEIRDSKAHTYSPEGMHSTVQLRHSAAEA